jgi:hypothetical protein
MAVDTPESSSQAAQPDPQEGKPKNLVDRIDDSFADNDQERMVKYMDWLRSTILDYMQGIRRNVTALLVLMAIFELVADSRNATLNIGSFHVTKDSVVLLFLPAVISFLYLQTVLDTLKAWRLKTVFSYVFDLWLPDSTENGISHFLYGPSPAYWATFDAPNVGRSDQFDKGESGANSLFRGIIVFGTFVFETQAYYVLFPMRAPAIAAWAVSLSVTLYCLLTAVGLMVFQAERRDHVIED